MTRDRLVVAVYRRFVRLYPRAFRDEYGADLVDLLAEQLRDEPTGRVVARCLADLALTIPNQHVEAHMERSSNLVVTCALGAVAFATAVVGVAVGHPAVLAVCLAIAALTAGLSLLNARRGRPLAVRQPAAAQWWKPAVAGVVVLAALVAITTATGELPEGGWFVAMATGLAGLLLVGTGLVLGLVHLAGRPARHAAT
jgi:uncharacterized membrane protein YedE/YeeE